jgi:esterase/lipase
MWGARITHGVRYTYALGVILLWGMALRGTYTVNHCKVGECGKIIARSDDHIKNAVVEKVKIYPQASENSTQRIERNGILVRYKDAVGTVLLCHGFMCDKLDVGFLRRLFPRGRYNIMSFDFRAHGENRENQFCTLGRDEAYDVIAAAQFLRNHPELQNKPLYVYGFSMGAVASIEAQAKVPLFDAMVLDCPFDSTENIVKRGLENLKFSLFGYTFYIPGRAMLQRYAFHPYVQSLVKMVLKAVAHMETQDIATRIYPITPAETIAKVTVPVLLIHCKNDAKISVDAIKTVFSNCGSDYKVLRLTHGKGHFGSLPHRPEDYTEWVRDHLEQADKGVLKTMKKQEIIEDSDDEIVSF